jgi:hypothetical protein
MAWQARGSVECQHRIGQSRMRQIDFYHLLMCFAHAVAAARFAQACCRPEAEADRYKQ